MCNGVGFGVVAAAAAVPIASDSGQTVGEKIGPLDNGQLALGSQAAALAHDELELKGGALGDEDLVRVVGAHVGRAVAASHRLHDKALSLERCSEGAATSSPEQGGFHAGLPEQVGEVAVGGHVGQVGAVASEATLEAEERSLGRSQFFLVDLAVPP